MNSHIEKLRVANERIPTQRRIELNITLQVFILARHPCEHYHNPFNFLISLFSSPVIPSPKSPHLLLPQRFYFQNSLRTKIYWEFFRVKRFTVKGHSQRRRWRERNNGAEILTPNDFVHFCTIFALSFFLSYYFLFKIWRSDHFRVLDFLQSSRASYLCNVSLLPQKACHVLYRHIAVSHFNFWEYYTTPEKTFEITE